MKVFTDAPNYANWLPNAEIVKSIQEADLVLFSGGEDVTPSYYGQKEGSQTYSNVARDKKEAEWYIRAIKAGKPMLGICRGSQFLTVMNGGKLIQHVSKHAGTLHPIKTEDKRVYTVNSTHHQMMYPYNLDNEDYRVIAWAEGLSTTYLDGDDKEISDEAGVLKEVLFPEPEVVFYPNTRCLCIQSHPEMHNFPKETINYFKELLSLIL